jgi:hypothetical protein
MPLVDTVISFGVAKASRFGLLQHPITLPSQMATSATDRKVTADIAAWSKLLSRCFAMSQDPTLDTAPLLLFAGTEARLPSCRLLAGRRGDGFDLLFFRLLGLPITLLLAFGHAHSLLLG